ncbi:MAG: Tad domain-containing protein [Anaerolineales bacterium]
MRVNNSSSERGQALILLVFAAVALLGFTALAIDGGMVYADRRHAQNAADAASLAGGGVAALHMENGKHLRSLGGF